MHLTQLKDFFNAAIRPLCPTCESVGRPLAMQWRYQLGGKEQILAQLPQLLEGFDPWVQQDAGSYFLRSRSFELGYPPSQEADLIIINTGQRALGNVNVSLALLIEGFQHLYIIGEYYLRGSEWVQKSAAVPISMTFTKGPHLVDVGMPPTQVLRAVAALMDHDKSSQMILGAVSVADWSSAEDLYAIAEGIRVDAGNQKAMSDLALAGRNELGRCFGTLSLRRKVIPRGNRPIRDLMSDDEIRLFVRRLVANWLEWRIKNLGGVSE